MAEQPLKFEEALDQLEKLVGEMESGALPLEELIARVEEGMKLVKLCRGKLDSMNERIEVLMKDDGAAGSFTEFNPDSERSRAALKPITPAAPPPEEPTSIPEPEAEDELPF